jgi:hypothetical protein
LNVGDGDPVVGAGVADAAGALLGAVDGDAARVGVAEAAAVSIEALVGPLLAATIAAAAVSTTTKPAAAIRATFAADSFLTDGVGGGGSPAGGPPIGGSGCGWWVTGACGGWSAGSSVVPDGSTDGRCGLSVGPDEMCG